MEFWEYITGEALILIPVLAIIGLILKRLEFVPDKFIPLILLAFGLAGGMLLIGVGVKGVIQGILVTGAAVYGHQLTKQLFKDE